MHDHRLRVTVYDIDGDLPVRGKRHTSRKQRRRSVAGIMKRLRLADRAADAVFPDVTTLIGEPSLDRLTSAALETTDSSGRALLFKMREMLYETEWRGASHLDILQTLVRTVKLLSDKIPCRQGIGGVFEVLDSGG